MAKNILFHPYTLLKAVEKTKVPQRRIWQRLFAPVAHAEANDKFALDVIRSPEGVVRSVTVFEPAVKAKQEERDLLYIKAPRLAVKDALTPEDVYNLRAPGVNYLAMETAKRKLARMIQNLKNTLMRTLEWWCAQTLKGQIVDTDGTVLLDYGMPSEHKPVVDWTASGSDPIADIRAWKRLIEDDAGGEIEGFIAFCGHEAMDALLDNQKVVDLIKYQGGDQLAKEGRIVRLAGIGDIIEYNGSFVDDKGNRKRFIDPKAFVLIGTGLDTFDCPYAPHVELSKLNQVATSLIYAKSWLEDDPEVLWIKLEARPLPIVRRPGAIVYATVTP